MTKLTETAKCQPQTGEQNIDNQWFLKLKGQLNETNM